MSQTRPTFQRQPTTEFGAERNTEDVRRWKGGGVVAIAAGALLLTACYLYGAVVYSTTNSLWLDEVLSVTLARMGSLSTIARAVWDGAEFSPPIFEMGLHFLVTPEPGTGRLVARLPSILALLAAAGCTYALARRGIGRLGALVAFGVVLDSGLFDFGVQVRQYALLALGTILAVLVWEGCERSQRIWAQALVLWAVLSACICLHFYGVVQVAVVGTAELLWLITRRQLRWPVWTAIVSTMATQAAWVPLALHLGQFNAGDAASANFYGKPTAGRFVDSVSDFVIDGRRGELLILAAMLLTAAAFVAARLGVRKAVEINQSRPIPDNGLFGSVEIALMALCTIPLVSFGLAFFVTHAFSARYMSAAGLIAGLGAGYIVDKLPTRRLVTVGLVLLLSAQLLQRAHRPDLTRAVVQVAESALGQLPIVVADGLSYVELMEAAPATLRPRLVYLLKPPGVISPDPTNDNIVRRILPYHPEYRVSETAEFVGANPSFYLLTRADVGVTDTTTPFLITKGDVGSPLTAPIGPILFEGGSTVHDGTTAATRR